MIRKAITLAKLLSRNQNSFIHLANQQKAIIYKPYASFGFFSNIFLSKEQKHLKQLAQQLYEVDATEKVIKMKEIINSKEQNFKKKDYDYYYFDQLVLAEYLMNAGKVEECNSILKQFDQPSKNISYEEVLARKLFLNSSNPKLLNDLEKILKNPTDFTSHSLPYGQLVLAGEYFNQKNDEKCEEILQKARDNIEVLLQHDQDKYSIGCKHYVNVLILLKFMQLYFKQKKFKELNKCLKSAFKSWDILEDNNTSALGYAINRFNPIYTQLIEMQIKVSEFFQDYSSAIDYYQTIIINYDKVNQNNSLKLIKLKLRQLNCLINESEFSDSKQLLKDLKEMIQQYQPDNNYIQAEYLMQEIYYNYRSKKNIDLNEKINEASQFCLKNKVLDMSYARILLIYLRLNSEKGAPELPQIINNLELILKSIEEVPAYIMVDYYVSSAQYYLSQKDQLKMSNYMSKCINLLKTPPPQTYSVVRSYYVWIGNLLQLDQIEQAKQLNKEVKEYADSTQNASKSEELKIKLLLLDIEQIITLTEVQNEKKK